MTNFRTIEVSDPAFETENLRIITVKSPALKRRGDVTLFLPPHSKSGGILPLLMLLHGVYGSHWCWTLKGGAHRAALQLVSQGRIRPIAIAMPSDGLWGDGSGYVRHGEEDYESWIMEDVVHAVREVTASVDATSPLFLAGLSMGGYGALRLGAKYAERVAGISAHSAITGPAHMVNFAEEQVWSGIAAADGATDPLFWLQRNSTRLPALRFDCGKADRLIEANRELHQQLLTLEIGHTYEEFHGGHDWTYWQEHIYDTLLFVEVTLQRA